MIGPGKNTRLRKSPFGELITVTPRPQTGWTFPTQIVDTKIYTESINGGTSTVENGAIVISTGTDPDGGYIASTRDFLTYAPGEGAYCYFTNTLDTPEENLLQMQGPFTKTLEDGWGFGYDGERFGIFKIRGGVQDWIYQDAWNVDTRPNINHSFGNVFYIGFQWLGYGMQYFGIENGETGEVELVHVIKYSNTHPLVSVFNPSIPITAYIKKNGGSTNNKTMRSPSAVAGLMGEPYPDAFEELVNHDISVAVGTGLTYLFGIRNPETFLGTENRLYARPVYFMAAVEGNKPASIIVYKNPNITTPNWTPMDGAVAALEYDEDGTYVPNGEIGVFSVPLGKSDSQNIPVENLGTRIPPGAEYGIFVDAEGATDVRVSITFKVRI